MAHEYAGNPEETEAEQRRRVDLILLNHYGYEYLGDSEQLWECPHCAAAVTEENWRKHERFHIKVGM